MNDDHDLFLAVVEAEIRLYGEVERRLRADSALALTQYEILRLVDAREGCRVGDLARELLITVGAASKAVDRLEADGWVCRLPNRTDRRSSLLELTDAGRPLLARATSCVEAELAVRFGALSVEDRRRLADLLHRLNADPPPGTGRQVARG